MTPYTVLSERQRVVKRQIREENRIHRACTEISGGESSTAQPVSDQLLASDNVIIETLVKSYRQIFTRHTWSMVPNEQGCNELRSPNYM